MSRRRRVPAVDVRTMPPSSAEAEIRGLLGLGCVACPVVGDDAGPPASAAPVITMSGKMAWLRSRIGPRWAAVPAWLDRQARSCGLQFFCPQPAAPVVLAHAPREEAADVVVEVAHVAPPRASCAVRRLSLGEHVDVQQVERLVQLGRRGRHPNAGRIDGRPAGCRPCWTSMRRSSPCSSRTC